MKYVLPIIVLALLSGCTLPPSPTAVAIETLVASPSLQASLTSTPQPTSTGTPTIGPVPDATVTATLTLHPFWTPSAPSLTEIPTEVVPIKLPDGSFNLLMLGSDARPSAPGLRTDTIMYVSFNPETETVTMISFPRDLYVFIPGWKVWRINGAWNQGGEEMLAQTFLYNFGLEVDQYILVDFTGFTGIINSVGGIDVSVGNSFVDECRGIEWSYLAGKTYHMDGDEALCYVRMRAATSDFARKERQAEIIVALFKKIGSLTGFRNVDELYSQYTQSVESDIGLTQVVNFAPIAVKLLKDDWRIQSTTITEEYVTNWRTPDEQAVLLPKVGAIQKLLEDALTK